MAVRCLAVFLLGLMMGVVAAFIVPLVVDVLPGYSIEGFLESLQENNSVDGLPWLFPGAYASYKAYGRSVFDQTEFIMTIRVEEVEGDFAVLSISSESFTWTFPVDLSRKEAVIESMATGLLGEAPETYSTDTYNTVFGPRSVIVASAGDKVVFIDSKALWPLAYAESNPDMQAMLIAEITNDTNIDIS
ncbi:hypothetical protein APE_1574.1 [Aeropyrum pernix K1]|uniref:Uncharacterized protein n=1 Tax=Aeropyrum pernix (strain ATCC 700893 / DSM 11879 / JCM 9820 / NBRC 100138 / K1) TaxID=272557 RepID=Q9YBM4_AERPE|nr:hypothetical protein [Aeropyrum pernix]BAA80574.2 hypothetical protein APE_1574.1 [Aeropyrum pernix K1]